MLQSDYSYRHCYWRQEQPAGPKVYPWFETQHHVNVMAKSFHAYGEEKEWETTTLFSQKCII